MRRINIYMALIVVTICFLLSTQVEATSLLTGGGAGNPTGFNAFFSGNAGFSFSVGSQDLTAASLGIFDHLSDGLFESHQVGLWTLGGTLLGSVTVPSGTSAALDNGFRFVNLSTPVTLSAGGTYVLGAFYLTSFLNPIPGDAFLSNNNNSPLFQMNAIMSSDAGFVGGRFLQTSSFAIPPAVSTNTGYVGPNLQYNTTPVPEPATLLLLGFGLIGLVGYARKKLILE